MATIIMCKNKIAGNVAYRAYRDGAVGVAVAALFSLATIPQCRCILYRVLSYASSKLVSALHQQRQSQNLSCT